MELLFLALFVALFGLNAFLWKYAEEANDAKDFVVTLALGLTVVLIIWMAASIYIAARTIASGIGLQ